MGLAGGGSVEGQHYTLAEFYQKALQIKAKRSDIWNNLGIVGGGKASEKNLVEGRLLLKGAGVGSKGYGDVESGKIFSEC